MTTIVASVNVQFTLTPVMAEACVRKVLKDRPDIVALQEWGPNRDPIARRIAKEGDYQWTRAKDGGVVMWKVARFQLKSTRPVRLARAEFVGRLPGRKSKLPVSVCTEVVLVDLAADSIVVVENFHLTAEVQDMKGGGGYKKDPLHLLRVLRHLREKHRLGKRMRVHKRRRRVVYGIGDGNYSGMRLGGFTNCWTDWTRGPVGTLGGRAVDIVFADKAPLSLWTLETPSDHAALVVAYH